MIRVGVCEILLLRHDTDERGISFPSQPDIHGPSDPLVL